MFTRGSLPGLVPAFLIVTGLIMLPARPVHAATEVKVTAEEEQPGGEDNQLKIDIECVPTPGNPSGVCRSGANPAKGTVECEVPPFRPIQRAVTCVFVAADGTSTFHSGPNGCSSSDEARWIVGIRPGTQQVIANNACRGLLPVPFVFCSDDFGQSCDAVATIEAKVNNKP